MNTEAIQMAEYAARRVLEARPRPSSVTQRQSAEMLNVSTATVSRMVKAGKLKMNGVGMIPISEIDRVLAAA